MIGMEHDVHLTSGQGNDENHLAAMVVIQQNVSKALKFHGCTESDKIILGDFNDNPFAKKPDGSLKFSDFLYQYMNFKRYTDLVTEDTGATRMDNNLTSIIDHVLVSRGANVHLVEASVERFQPADSTHSGLAGWRKTFSDHFPLTVKMEVANSDDDVD